jgi:16S rRNA (cytosine1402-N4)-methyltransferase
VFKKLDKTSENESENSFEHKSVLLKETVEATLNDTDGIYVDCTLGGAGHALFLAGQISQAGWLIGIDQDKEAILAAKARFSKVKCKVSIVQDNFKNLKQILNNLGVSKVNGVIFDLGVSSYQLDNAGRGFSYMQDAPLDMRMNPADNFSAYDIVNTYSEKNLESIIREYGEEKWARRIAQFILIEREPKPLKTTGELVEILKRAIPANARREGPHPAKRTFQALRIEVNDELGILKNAFKDAIDVLIAGGRLSIITFHSLEDRIAKQTIKELAAFCICPPKLPVCMCNNVPALKTVSKIITPSEEELEQNPRSRSAKLRVAEKLF